MGERGKDRKKKGRGSTLCQEESNTHIRHRFFHNPNTLSDSDFFCFFFICELCSRNLRKGREFPSFEITFQSRDPSRSLGNRVIKFSGRRTNLFNMRHVPDKQKFQKNSPRSTRPSFITYLFRCRTFSIFSFSFYNRFAFARTPERWQMAKSRNCILICAHSGAVTFALSGRAVNPFTYAGNTHGC